MAARHDMAHSYAEIFDAELQCWCYGLAHIRERIERNVFHKVIKEFAPVLREAVEHGYVCDVVGAAHRLIEAARTDISEKEAAFHILSQLPCPKTLNDDQAHALSEIVARVDHTYPGAAQRLEKKWGAESGQAFAKHSETSHLSGLSFPHKPIQF